MLSAKQTQYVIELHDLKYLTREDKIRTAILDKGTVKIDWMVRSVRQKRCFRYVPHDRNCKDQNSAFNMTKQNTNQRLALPKRYAVLRVKAKITPHRLVYNIRFLQLNLNYFRRFPVLNNRWLHSRRFISMKRRIRLGEGGKSKKTSVGFMRYHALLVQNLRRFTRSS